MAKQAALMEEKMKSGLKKKAPLIKKSTDVNLINFFFIFFFFF